MNRWFKKGMTVLCLASIAAGSIAGCGSEGGNTDGGDLIFLIWDSGQKAGMEAMAEAYMSEHPDVHIEVQATGWDEYWTKLEGAATSNTMPDIFWMHSNQMYKYADNGILADCSGILNESDYSEISLANAKGSDGKVYGVPKDKDLIALLYNKELFDAAGVAYPDESWTWADMEEASEKINESTGKYGYMAFSHDQIGYWNFVYQNGGQILNGDGTAAAYTDPATSDAIKYYVRLQDYAWCPTQAQFANTGASELFFSGEGAMDFLAFLGSEEGQKIQGESGVAIPAFNGLEDTWVQTFADNGYELHVGDLTDSFNYSIKYVNNPSRPAWEPRVEQIMLDIYAGSVTLEEGIQSMQDAVTEAIEEY